MATVELTAEANEQLADLPREIQGRIRNVMKRLENWPTVSGVKKLTGNLSGWFRARTGDYRIRFHIKEEVKSVKIIVDKIGHRKDVYEG